MKIVRCDICNKEMEFKPFECDSETQYYTLINKYAGRDLETDICNGCMHKLIDFVNDTSVVTNRAKGVWTSKFYQGVDKLLYECSNCHTRHTITNYCPNCGAKMKGTDE